MTIRVGIVGTGSIAVSHDICTRTRQAAYGGHGYGMRNTGHPVNTWPERCKDWMTKQGYLKK